VNPIRYLEKRIRGWLPKEPSLAPRNQTTKNEVNEAARRNQLKISIVDGIMAGTFAALHSSIAPRNENFECTVIPWAFFIFSLISVNALLYKYFNRKTSSQLEQLRQ
jgi:hypothetical protein